MQFVLFVITLLLIAIYNNIYESFTPLSNEIYNSNSYGLNLDMKLSNEKTDIISNANPYNDDTCSIIDKPKKECCLITDELIEQQGGLYNSKFVYIYKKLYDDDCDDKKYNTNTKTQLFIDGINGWNNNMCQSGALGSCRFDANTCIDIQRKKECDKANLDWSPLPCEQNRPIVFDDRLKPSNKLPKMPNYGTPDGTIKFFP